MIERLNILKSKKFPSATDLREALKNDTGFRNEVKTLSKRFLGKSVSGCGNCFFDAYMELINIKNMKEESKFQVIRGKVLHDTVNQDVSKILTYANCTDELALYHLKHNPNARKFFSTLPDDVDELIENYGKEVKKSNGKEPIELSETELAEIEPVKAALASGKAQKSIA